MVEQELQEIHDKVNLLEGQTHKNEKSIAEIAAAHAASDSRDGEWKKAGKQGARRRSRSPAKESAETEKHKALTEANAKIAERIALLKDQYNNLKTSRQTFFTRRAEAKLAMDDKALGLDCFEDAVEAH